MKPAPPAMRISSDTRAPPFHARTCATATTRDHTAQAEFPGARPGHAEHSLAAATEQQRLPVRCERKARRRGTGAHLYLSAAHFVPAVRTAPPRVPAPPMPRMLWPRVGC